MPRPRLTQGSSTTELAQPDVDFSIDYEDNPEQYESGRGEFGVWNYQPYSDRLRQHWGYDTVEQAEEDAEWLYEQFQEYVADGNYVGADMARKFLEMGWTRSMRYAKYPGGEKDGNDPQYYHDKQKREIARIYRDYLDMVQSNSEYSRLETQHSSGELYE